MSRSKSVLLLTNSELGQANVHLAVAYSILQQDPTVQVHIASFKRLRRLVQEVSDLARSTNTRGPGAVAGGDSDRKPRPIRFHELAGPSYEECLVYLNHDFFALASQPPDFQHSFSLIRSVVGGATPWRAEQFLTVFQDVVRVLTEVDPDIIAVDNFFGPGITACHHLQRNWIVLSPNTLLDYVISRQPNAAGLWKYPRFGFVTEWPMPWYLRPLNIFYCLYAGFCMWTDQNMNETRSLLKSEAGVDFLSSVDLLTAPPSGLKILVGNRAEIDFPFDVIPPEIVTCGPILRPSASIYGADLEVVGWLSAGPTVLINLGTHMVTDEALALEMAGALRIVFDAAYEHKMAGLRVLWKLKQPADAEYGWDVKSRLYQVLGREIACDRVRIESWLKAEPGAIIESGHVICSVNHGGANSWNEGVCAGIPQVILPQWVDTYDFAVRTEMLGIGLNGSSRKTQPRWSAAELGPKLVRATMGDEARNMRAKAQELARVCREGPQGLGRDFAARYILDRLY